MERTSSENIAEALNLLEEAARQKKDELKTAIGDKYTHLRGLLIENETSVVNALATAKDRAIAAAAQVKEASIEKAREIDANVHRNPWPYIAGTAAVTLLLGYVLGRNRK